MAGKMAAAEFRWRGRLLLAISAPVIGLPLLSTVKAGSMHVHPRELDIYSEPETLHYQTEEEEISPVEKKVSIARRSVWGWARNAKEGLARVRTTLSSLESKTLEFAKLIRTDQTFQIKVGGITAGILGGALLAGRGRRPVRRTLFAFALGSTAAAICYPKQAVDMSLASYDRLKEFVKQQKIQFNQEKTPVISDQQPTQSETIKEHENTGQPVSSSMERELPEQSVSEKVNLSNANNAEEEVVAPKEEPESSLWSKIPFLDKLTGGIFKTSQNVGAPADNGSDTKDVPKDQVIIQEEMQSHGKIDGDTGQSNPEDEDMYSTRS